MHDYNKIILSNYENLKKCFIIAQPKFNIRKDSEQKIRIASIITKDHLRYMNIERMSTSINVLSSLKSNYVSNIDNIIQNEFDIQNSFRETLYQLPNDDYISNSRILTQLNLNLIKAILILRNNLLEQVDILNEFLDGYDIRKYSQFLSLEKIGLKIIDDLQKNHKKLISRYGLKMKFRKEMVPHLILYQIQMCHSVIIYSLISNINNSNRQNLKKVEKFIKSLEKS
jgi:hypothetical protein